MLTQYHKDKNALLGLAEVLTICGANFELIKQK